jgi:hypothetical protein
MLNGVAPINVACSLRSPSKVRLTGERPPYVNG